MPQSHRSLRSHDTKTIIWFEREIQDGTLKHSILDAVSLGVWGVAEQSGILAGEWRRHRNFSLELDTIKVTATLGELLEAIVQTAQAIGIPLEAVMEQQVERVHQRQAEEKRQKKAALPRTRHGAETASVPTITASPDESFTEPQVPSAVAVRRPRGRPRKHPLVADMPLVSAPEASLTSPVGGQRRHTHHHDDAALPHTMIPPIQRRVHAVPPAQPTLLNETTPPPTAPSRRRAKAQ